MRKQDNWLLLMHQIPPKLDSFRVKIWRLLQKAGALQLKNSVYVLPFGEENQQKFDSIVQEINSNQGDAFVCRATFIKGIEDREIIEKFDQDRGEKYELLAEDLRFLQKVVSPQDVSENDLMGIEHSIGKLERQVKELVEMDFFSCKDREPTLKLLKSILQRVDGHRNGFKGKILKRDLASYQKRTWVTRNQVHVDRLASAWLISKFIDKKPNFKFVKGHNYKATKNEVRFDMFEGEFTHIGDKCTFEVLTESFQLTQAPIAVIAEIIHDLDLKDTKYNRPETMGIGMVINSLVSNEPSDDARIKKASALFDDLHKTIEDGFKNAPHKLSSKKASKKI